MTEEAKKIIEKLSLEPLEGEGGFFRFLTEYGNGAGCIYYLVTEESFSHLHLLTDDEVWVFLEGDRAQQITVDQSLSLSRTVLGPENRIVNVEKNNFQGTKLLENNHGYALFSTFMSPRYKGEMYMEGKKDPRIREMEEVKEYL